MYTHKHTHKPETLRLSTDTGSRLLLLQIILIPILYCAQVMRGLIFRGAFRRQKSEVRVSLNPAVDVRLDRLELPSSSQILFTDRDP